MIEFFLAFFIFVTIFVDSLALIAKSVDLKRRFAVSYVVSQALTYITRLSLFFILPIIGLILDGVIKFKLELFLIHFASLLFLHSVIMFFMEKTIKRNAKFLIYYFSYSLRKFFTFLFFNLFKNAELLWGVSSIKVLYLIAHMFLSLIFPVVLIIGLANQEYRALLMGSISAYSGVFSLYILFMIERKIPNLAVIARGEYIETLIFSKVIATLLSGSLLLAYVLVV